MRGFDEAFGDWWAVLSDRFSREPSQATTRFYHRVLQAALTVHQLDEAMARVAYSGQFFPSPEEIVQAVGGSDEATALRQWELCERAVRGLDPDLSRLSESGRRAVRLIGGLRHLRGMQESDLPFRRKEFLGLFKQADEITQREQQALPEWTPEGRATMRRLLTDADGDHPSEGAA